MTITITWTWETLFGIAFIILCTFIGIAILVYSVGVGSSFAEEVLMIEKNSICETAKGYESNYQYCDKLYDELEAQDEKEHEDESNQWNYPNEYPFVRCPGDTNTYPEGTKCE